MVKDGTNSLTGIGGKSVDEAPGMAKELHIKSNGILAQKAKRLAVKETARKLAKKEARFAVGPQGLAFFRLVSFAAFYPLFILFAKLSTNQYEAIFFAYAAVAMLYFSLLALPLVAYDVSSLRDAVSKFKAGHERRESRKSKMSISFDNLETYAEQYDSCILIDTRSADVRERLPIYGALEPPEDLAEFAKKLSPTTVVFACSSFGKESYLQIKGLRELGVKASYDMGGVKDRSHLISRSMKVLACLQDEGLLRI
jgi:hypothetical protein